MILKDCKVRVKDGWGGAGNKGVCLGEPVFVGQWWLPVKWDNEDDPDFFKITGLEIMQERWVDDSIFGP